MDYAIRILLEKKLDIEVEMEKGDSDKRNSLKKKYIDVTVALNKLNLTRVSKTNCYRCDAKKIDNGWIYCDKCQND